MIDNIKNYGDEVKTLKDFVTAVRKRPGMHIGSIGNPGFRNMIREILQNSMDEQNKPSSPCDMVWLTFDEASQSVIVEDNGRGIPFGKILDIFEKEYTSSNYDKKPGEYSSGLHGVGAKVTNALSSTFIIESYILGDARRVEFTEGYPWKQGEKKIPNKDNRQGTKVMFTPSKEAMGETNITWVEVMSLAELILPLAVPNARIKFSALDSKGEKHEKLMVNQDGVLTYLINTIKQPLIKPIRLFKDTGYKKMDIVFTYDLNVESQGAIFAFANTCPTTLGTHIDGFYEGLASFFTTYMNKTYLVKNLNKVKNTKKKDKKPLTVTAADTRASLGAVISVAHLEPIFDGQSKEKLSNEDMKPFVKSTTMDLLDAWSKDNVQDFLKVCKYLKDVAELRNKSDDDKVKLSNKYSKSSLTGLPDKFVAPTGKAFKDDLEFFITEGDSAAGTMKNHRINKCQGYFPIRGKLPNAFNWPRAKFLSNPEIAGIISIIFDGVKEFDISMLGKKSIKDLIPKIKWKKIIIATDADEDGRHITALIIRFFILYLPELIEAGLLYKCLPPLYGMSVAKTAKSQRINLGDGQSSSKRKMTYFIDRLEYIKYIQRNFSKSYSIADLKGNVLSSSVLSKVLYDNIDYTYELERIANRYSIDPMLLESILLLRKETFANMSKKLKKQYRFLDVKKNNDMAIIEGIVNGKYQTVFYNEKLLNDCTEIIKILNKNLVTSYMTNNTIVSLYGLMKLFESSTPPSIERYKGLGEMDGPKLFESTLDPDNRTLVQFTIQDIKAELEQIRYYENNINVLINSVGELSRHDVMG